MDSNQSVPQFQDSLDDIEKLPTVVLAVPEYINIILLAIAIRGTYQGIEIKHPLYTILFTNLIFVFIMSMGDIIGYALIPIKKYVLLSNLLNLFSYLVHSSGWCLASILRYIYIFHDNWISSMIPKENVQCFLAVLSLFMTTTLLFVPIIILAKYYGKSKK